MKNILIIAIFLITTFAITSCPGRSYIRPPDNFALEFTVENKMDVPVDVSIRSYHDYREGESKTRSEWQTITLESNETRLIGGNEDDEKFVMITPALVSFLYGVGDALISFEMKLETPGKTIYLAGYETEEPGFDDSGLLYFEVPLMGWCVLMFSKEQIACFYTDYSLSVKLVINEDGTVTFIEEMVQEGSGITIFKPVY